VSLLAYTGFIHSDQLHIAVTDLFMENISQYYRLWSRQFLREFSSICYQYSLFLDSPVFAITESNTEFGSWRSWTREIRISSNLIKNYPWDVTLQVLKHEMAHQMCSEIFHDQRGGHGENFIKACEMLGLPEQFRQSDSDLPQKIERWTDNDTSNERSRNIIEKIRKLLALAQSSNEHESALAMEIAGRLLKRHNLQQLHEDEQNNYVYSIINRKRKRIEEYQRRIILVLTQFFYVKAICSSLYDPICDQIFKTFEIFGKKENVEIATYCYHFLEQKLPALWQQNFSKFKGNARIARKSYYLGLLQGFREKLLEQDCSGHPPKPDQVLSRPSTSSELVVAGDTGLNRFIQARYPRLTKRSKAGAKIYRETYDDGVMTGRSIVIHKGIAGDCKKSGRLLP
jgi:hypothetical protein